jgi:hypothetical protein
MTTLQKCITNVTGWNTNKVIGLFVLTYFAVFLINILNRQKVKILKGLSVIGIDILRSFPQSFRSNTIIVLLNILHTIKY